MFEKYRGGLRKREKKKEDWEVLKWKSHSYSHCIQIAQDLIFNLFHSYSHISFSSSLYFLFCPHPLSWTWREQRREREWKMSNEAEEQLSSSTWWKWLLAGGAAHLYSFSFIRLSWFSQSKLTLNAHATIFYSSQEPRRPMRRNSAHMKWHQVQAFVTLP